MFWSSEINVNVLKLGNKCWCFGARKALLRHGPSARSFHLFVFDNKSLAAAIGWNKSCDLFSFLSFIFKVMWKNFIKFISGLKNITTFHHTHIQKELVSLCSLVVSLKSLIITSNDICIHIIHIYFGSNFF